jgi:cell fate (sporulation/competence/biofilm development) regulator YlbF (YheA/YmcA/DUF963 family)
MATTAAPALQDSVRRFCADLVAAPEFESIRQRVDLFMINDAAKLQYQRVTEHGEHLHHKQQQGVTLGDAEIADFERQRDLLLNNPVARGFLDAQEEIQGLQQQVTTWLNKTFELGRVPEADELDHGGGCGQGCGCKH